MAEKEGFFKEAGLEVAINSPSDPSAPLKDVAAGRADLAITYEPRGDAGPRTGARRGRRRGARQPAADLADLAARNRGSKASPDLKGKTVSYAGIPYQEAFLKTILRPRQSARLDGQTGERRLRPDALAGQRLGPGDARRLLQRRGRRPAAKRGKEPGDHPGRRTRRADLRRARLRRPPLDPGRRGRTDPPLHQRPAARHRSGGRKIRKRRPKRSSPPTPTSNRNWPKPRSKRRCRCSSAPPPGKPYGWMDPKEWEAFAAWMRDEELISNLPKASELLTNAYLVDEIPE